MRVRYKWGLCGPEENRAAIRQQDRGMELCMTENDAIIEKQEY